MEQKENSKVILVIVVGFLVIAYFIGSGENSKHNWADGLTIAATLIGLIQIISPTLGNFVVKGWNMIGLVLGWINTRILLSIVFYFVVFPVAMIYKLTNKNSLQRKRISGSIFRTRNHSYTAKNLENIW